MSEKLTPEQLLEENTALKSGLAVTEKALNALQEKAKSDAATIEALEQAIADQDAQITELKASNVAPDRKAKGAVLATFKIGKDQYGIVYPALFVNGKRLTAEQIANNPETCKGLVADNSSAVKKL
jgi:septal ring factor EnvC (AmiA/AmiB activator)